MTGQAIGTSLNRGFPGSFARTPDDIIVSRPVATGAGQIIFGAPVQQNGDSYLPADATLSMANFAGFAVRIVKQSIVYVDQNVGAYLENQPASVMVRGNITVTCKTGAPAVGGAVYVRIAADGVKAVGDIEALADGANTVQLTNCEFNSTADSNGACEICIKTRNKA